MPDLTPEQQKQIDGLNAVAAVKIQQIATDTAHLIQQVLTGPDPDENRRDWNESVTPQESKP